MWDFPFPFSPSLCLSCKYEENKPLFDFRNFLAKIVLTFLSIWKWRLVFSVLSLQISKPFAYLNKMDLDRKIWCVFGVLFYIGGVTALSTSAWRVSTTAALVLGLFCEFHRYLEPILGRMLPVMVNACNIAVSFFCVLMVLRPVITDFGIFYALCVVTTNLSLGEFGLGWPTWLVFPVLILLGVAVWVLVLDVQGDVQVAQRAGGD